MRTTNRTETKKLYIFDCQVFQTSTFHRGMGRYSKKFLETLFLKQESFFDNHEVVFLLNKNIKTNKERRKEIKSVYNKATIITVDIPTSSVSNRNISTKEKILTAENTLTDFIRQKYKHYEEISFTILSNFEIFQSIAAFPKQENVVKMLLFYDLIPYLFYKKYLKNNLLYQEEYYSRFRNIFLADKILTISNTTKIDLINFLNIKPSKIINIDGALIETNKKSTRNNTNIYNKYAPFFLAPSGNDFRKNNDVLIKAFAQFSKKNKNKYSLLITSSFSEKEIKRLLKIRNDINPKAKIYFLGHISDEELEQAYQKALAIIFIPSYEGLGLPVLEGVKFNKKLILSNIPVFKEISQSAFLYCDPKNLSSIIKQLEIATLDSQIDGTSYKKIKQKYTWENTVEKAFDIFKNPKKDISHKIKKEKIAIIGPDPHSYSAIVKFIEELWPMLFNRVNKIDYYYDNGLTQTKFRGSFLPFVANKYLHISKLNQKNSKQYKHIIYNMGNSEFHVATYKKAQFIPGTLIMHDATLEGMLHFAVQNHLIEAKRVKMEKDLEKLLKTTGLTTSLINSNKKIIVHSKFTKDNFKKKFLNKKSKLIQLSLPTNFTITQLTSKKNQTKKLVVSLAGIIAKEKGLDLFLDTIRYFKKYDVVVFKIFGFDYTHTFKSKIDKYKNIKVLTNLSDLEFQTELQNTDILINYRSEYHGEASLTSIEGFRYGVTEIVRDIGWFSELPDDVVIKVKDPKEIKNKLNDLINNPNKLKKIGKKAFEHAQRKLNPEVYVEELLKE